MRIVRAPADCLGLTRPRDSRLAVGRFLSFIGSGLWGVSFKPPEDLARIVGAPLARRRAAQWIDDCFAWAGESVRWLMTILQAEQSLVTLKRSLPAAWTVRHVMGPDKNGLFPGERVMRTKAKTGYIAVGGEWRMMAATGFAIPDPGARAGFTTELYLGFPRQIFHVAKWLRDRELEFSRIERKGKLPKVTLYAKKGKKPETVLCADRYAYKTLRYTPSESVMAKRGKIFRMLSELGGGIWSS